MKKSKILNLHDKLINKQISVKEVFDQMKKVFNNFKHTNSIITNTMDLIDVDSLQSKLDENKNNLLYAIPYTLKDNIATKNIRTTGGSEFLRNFVPPYSATVYKLLDEQNAMLLGKANLDEFGMGNSGLTTAYGEVCNYYDNSRISCGSSSGSVNSVAAGFGLFSIGTDTGDSVRKPSSYIGTVGYKPSYGAISRYGVYPYAPSLDHVGIIADYVTDVAIVAQYILKHDENDFTSYDLENKYYENLKLFEKPKIAIFEGVEQFLEPDILNEYNRVIQLLKDNGVIVEKVKVDWKLMETLYMSYRYISFTEALSCYHNFTGVTFGTNQNKSANNFKEMATINRTKGFGKEVKYRFVYASLVDRFENFRECFNKAKKAARLYVKFVNNIFEKYDTYLVPCASSVAPTIKEFKNHIYHLNTADDLLMLGNFCHTPSITLPTAFVGNLPWGINLNCKKYEDQKLLNIALRIEEILDFNKEVNR